MMSSGDITNPGVQIPGVCELLCYFTAWLHTRCLRSFLHHFFRLPEPLGQLPSKEDHAVEYLLKVPRLWLRGALDVFWLWCRIVRAL